MLNGIRNSFGLNRAIQQNILQLSSGKRLTSASVDAAGVSVAQNLTKMARGIGQSTNNLGDALKMLNVADGGLSGISDMLQRQRELGLQAANGTLNDDQRNAINNEISQINEEIDRTVNTVEYNGQKLLQGDNFDIQSGANSGDQINLTTPNSSTSALGTDSINASTQSGAIDMLDKIDSALNSVNEQRTVIGAQSNRIEHTINNQLTNKLNTESSLSLIEDMDIASGQNEFYRNQMLSGMSSRVEAMQNQIISNNQINLYA